VAVDEAELCGLTVPRLPDDLVAELRQLSLPQFASFKNPVDMAMVAAEPFRDIALTADRYDVADVMLLIFGDPTPGAAEAAKETAARVRARVVAVCFGGGNVEKVERAKMHAAGIPVFPTPERAIRATAAAVRYADFRQELQAAA
jgi:acetyltransferase